MIGRDSSGILAAFQWSRGRIFTTEDTENHKGCTKVPEEASIFVPPLWSFVSFVVKNAVSQPVGRDPCPPSTRRTNTRTAFPSPRCRRMLRLLPNRRGRGKGEPIARGAETDGILELFQH